MMHIRSNVGSKAGLKKFLASDSTVLLRIKERRDSEISVDILKDAEKRLVITHAYHK